MSDRVDPRDARMDPAALYREDVVTDRKVGTIRVLAPIRADGSADPSRAILFVGEAQMLTSMGPVPITFEIEAKDLSGAVAAYGEAAKEAFDRTLRELQEMRRQAASSIVVPQAGAGAFGAGGGGKIQLP